MQLAPNHNHNWKLRLANRKLRYKYYSCECGNGKSVMRDDVNYSRPIKLGYPPIEAYYHRLPTTKEQFDLELFVSTQEEMD